MPSLEKRLENCVLDIMKRYQGAGYFPTCSVRVFNKAGTLCTAQVGDAREGSVFDVASVSKIATATQVLFLIDEGRVSLDAKIGDYLPQIEQNPFLRDRLKDVTIFKLLTHTSAIVDWYPFYVNKGMDFYDVLEIALRKYPPVTGMVYSDLNFMLLGKLLEKMSGLPLDACLEKNLKNRLDLGNIMYHPELSLDLVPAGFGNTIEMDMCAERSLVFNGFRPVDEEVRGTGQDGNAHYFFDDAAGHAGVFAAPLAYERLCRFYMTTDKPIFLLAQKEQAPTRGLGLQVSPIYPHGCGHMGFTGTEIYFSRSADIGVIAFTNRLYYHHENPNSTNDFRRAINEAVYSLYVNN